jgi:hypothetical protein
MYIYTLVRVSFVCIQVWDPWSQRGSLIGWEPRFMKWRSLVWIPISPLSWTCKKQEHLGSMYALCAFTWVDEHHPWIRALCMPYLFKCYQIFHVLYLFKYFKRTQSESNSIRSFIQPLEYVNRSYYGRRLRTLLIVICELIWLHNRNKLFNSHFNVWKI